MLNRGRPAPAAGISTWPPPPCKWHVDVRVANGGWMAARRHTIRTETDGATCTASSDTPVRKEVHVHSVVELGIVGGWMAARRHTIERILQHLHGQRRRARSRRRRQGLVIMLRYHDVVVDEDGQPAAAHQPTFGAGAAAA